MANSPANTNRLYDGGIQFLLGVNSNLHPSFLLPNQYAWAVNRINKGGLIDTRPGYASMFRLPDGRAQGMVSFTPTGGKLNLVMAVNGSIYVSEFPFVTYTKLNNIQFDPSVDHIVFKEAVQAKSGSTLIDPISVLMMQDGSSRAAYWDGSTDRHLNPGVNETLIGLWMEWIGNRLWVARGRQLFASDIFDPLHFTENTYLSAGGALNAMDGAIITALARTADNRSLLVFTIHNTTIVKAGITDRTQWKTTQDFIALLFPGVGCIAGISPFYHNGLLWWWSVEGARNFTQVGSSILTSNNGVSSIEMKRSFDNITDATQSNVCGFSVGTFLGFSVPSGDLFNRHTWVLDTSTNSQLTGNSPWAWQGIWMGTRPVQWTTANVNGHDRAFYISQDRCGIRVWEAFKDDKTDNGERIYGSIELGGLDFKEQSAFKRFDYSEYHLTHVSGEVTITGDYRTEWGCWKPNVSLELCAQPCFTELICNGVNPTIMSQSRYFKTQEALHSCFTKEGAYSEDIGTYAQSRIRWYGKAALRIHKANAIQFQETSNGACTKSDVGCITLACCDAEVDYISHVKDSAYGYPSSNQIDCNI